MLRSFCCERVKKNERRLLVCKCLNTEDHSKTSENVTKISIIIAYELNKRDFETLLNTWRRLQEKKNAYNCKFLTFKRY